MDWSDRALAVSLSVGGRARTIAQSIPHHILAQPNGLQILIQRFEADLGSELQDRVRAAKRTFDGIRRHKGTNISEFLVIFEQAYQTACDHGLYLSVPMLTMTLIDACGLTSSQEEWILSCVGGDYSRYGAIRHALRRLPMLDSRHDKDAQAWAAQHHEQSQRTSSPENDRNSVQEYKPFSGMNQGLNTMPIPPDN